MPITLAKIASNTASVTITDGEDTAAVVYYPGRLTEKSIAKLNSLSEMDESSMEAGFKAFNEELARLIASWEVLDDDGSMFPLDPERLAELSIDFRMRVLGAIIGDIRPNQEATPSQTPN